jgi:uncharacterized protein (DUF362 family)
MYKIFIDDLNDGYKEVLHRGFEFLTTLDSIKKSDKITIKPNLTFPTFRKGVMTNPEAVEALIVYLKNYTDNITICESDSGGYNRFSMDEVYEKTGLKDMAKKYGVRLVNMSYEPSKNIPVNTGLNKLTIPLPLLILDETDLFITMPVPKVHLNSIISVAIKNQWGVIQEPSIRLKLHPYFKHVIYEVNKSLPKSIVVVDGKYGLNRTGPLKGDEVNLDWLIMADNIFYCDMLVCDLMGFDYRKIPYLKYIFRKEKMKDLKDVEFNTGYNRFKKEKFYLKRLWTDYPGVMTFNSRLLAYIGYESFLAKPLHWLLYKFREPFY